MFIRAHRRPDPSDVPPRILWNRAGSDVNPAAVTRSHPCHHHHRNSFHQPYRTKAMTDGAADVRPWSAAGRSIRAAVDSQWRRQHHHHHHHRLFLVAVCTGSIAVVVIAPRDSLDARLYLSIGGSDFSLFSPTIIRLFSCVQRCCFYLLAKGCYFL